jgi:hypothetical protein
MIILRDQNIYFSGQFFLIAKKAPFGSKGLNLNKMLCHIN